MVTELAHAAAFQLSAEPPKKRLPKPVKYVKEKREEKATPRDRQLAHDAMVVNGSAPPGRCSESQPLQEDEEWFRHHNWKEKRTLVIQALHSAGTGIRQMDSFQNCGSECVIEWNAEEKRYRLRGSYCHSRHCEPCMKSKANLLAANLKAKLADNPNSTYRFITLTLRHSKESTLIDQLKKLYDCWKKLRNTKLWKGSQIGGAATLEVKWSATNGWHAHLHVISEGNYIQQAELSSAWHAITKDSYKVDIRMIHKKKDVAWYLAKYVSKGTNNEVWNNADAAAEWIIATKGVRTCATYGTWRGFKLLEKPKDTGHWKPVELLRNVARRARDGSIADILMLESLQESFQYNPHRQRAKTPDKRE